MKRGPVFLALVVLHVACANRQVDVKEADAHYVRGARELRGFLGAQNVHQY